MISPIDAATDRLLATVDALDDWSAPSHCAGWSRAHVIAHLALNAEGYAGAVEGALAGRVRPVYRSAEGRDDDIAQLAAEPPARIRPRLRSACARIAAALELVPDLPERSTVDWAPGGPVARAERLALMRLREVEIHHADLRAGYSAADWPPEGATAFLRADAHRYDGPGFHAVATDAPVRVTFGQPGVDAATVSGPLGALAWWASGRDPGPVLSSTNGTLPTMEAR